MGVPAQIKSNKSFTRYRKEIQRRKMPPPLILYVSIAWGQAVIAGRGSPNSIVTVRDKEKLVGTIKTDTSGAWVLVPKEPIKSGRRVLSLSEETSSGKKKTAKKKVILVVPKVGKGHSW